MSACIVWRRIGLSPGISLMSRALRINRGTQTAAPTIRMKVPFQQMLEQSGQPIPQFPSLVA
jgi:hypothetical protein